MPDFPQSGKWSLREHAIALQGDAAFPTTLGGSGIWSTTEVSRKTALSSWPVFTTFAGGGLYAQSYIATTSGTITSHVPTSGSLNSAIDALSDGDALLLAAGSYTIDALQCQGYGSDSWRNKNILIAGSTENANDVVLEVTHSAQRGKHIFASVDTATYPAATVNKQIAFLRYKRLATSTTNYINAIAVGYSTDPAKGRAVNCIFDFNNSAVCWMYDNYVRTTHDIEFVRCTFLNYSTWGASYSGAVGTMIVGDCLFDDTYYNTNNRATVTSSTASATITVADGSYNTSTYGDGHLYIPNTTAVF